MPQLLLDHAQFFAEVVFRADGEYDILRVARGDSTLAGRRLVLPNVRDVVPRSCCEHHPPAVAAGHAYWVASPGQLESRGRRVTLDHPQVFDAQDERVTYLRGLHDVTPAELASILESWRDGRYPPHEFSELIVNLDVPSAGPCLRPYYHWLLMVLTYEAWGNQDHVKCAPARAREGREAAARDALSVLGLLENNRRTGRMACVHTLSEVVGLPSLLERQEARTNGLYPCTNPTRK